jgi:hypothetical protein
MEEGEMGTVGKAIILKLVLNKVLGIIIHILTLRSVKVIRSWTEAL